MIAFKSDLPLLEFRSGHVVGFEREWLSGTLRKAAAAAGYPNWWLADHVTESITHYLVSHYPDNVLAECRLTKAVQSVLQAIGYSEVGSHFLPTPPPIQVSLLEIAYQAGSGYELLFFDLLSRRVQDLINLDFRSFHFTSLTLCVKHLSSSKQWRKECNRLQDEIVVFLRSHVASTSPHDIEFMLS